MVEEHEKCPWLLMSHPHGTVTSYSGSFGRLRDAEHLVNVLCVGLRLTDQPDDWSEYVTRFKGGGSHEVESASAIFEYALCFRPFRRSVESVVACPMLGSADLGFNPRGSVGAAFGRLMADPPKIRIEGVESAIGDGRSMIYKAAVRPPLHRMRTVSERLSAVRGTHQAKTFAEVGLPDANVVILLDDIVTLGSSMNDAARAIKEANPLVERVYGIALGKSERCSYSGVDNKHLPQHIRRLAGIDG